MVRLSGSQKAFIADSDLVIAIAFNDLCLAEVFIGRFVKEVEEMLHAN